MKNFQRSLAAALAVAIALSGTACSSHKKKDELFDNSEKSERQIRAEAGALYRKARQNLDSSDFNQAVEQYETLSKRYPFTDFATQGEIEKIYALYRNYDSDKALSSADRFMREHPRNPSIDYVQYLRGLINFNRDPSFSSMVGASTAKGDVTNYRRSFDDFALLVQKYPTSKYVGDARERMIYLRNTVAEHDLDVVDFYVSRGAYLAAAKRAEQIVAEFPGAPSTYRALQLMELSYRRAGLMQQADDTHRLLAGQPEEARTIIRTDDANRSASERSWLDRLLGRNKPATVDAPPPVVDAATPAPAATTATATAAP